MAIGMNERKNTCLDIMSQNLRSLREDKEEEIILLMVERNLWAACLQEIGSETAVTARGRMAG